MAGFLVCCAVRRLLTTGHNILSPKSLSNTRQLPANTDLMLLVATQSWHCASSCVSGYNQDNIEHKRETDTDNQNKERVPEEGLKDYNIQCVSVYPKPIQRNTKQENTLSSLAINRSVSGKVEFII